MNDQPVYKRLARTHALVTTSKHRWATLRMMRVSLLLALVLPLAAQSPDGAIKGTELPNGWRLTPAGRHAVTMDYVLNVLPAPDRKALVGLHSGFNPHGLIVADPVTAEIVQRIPQKSAWLGLAWSPDGTRLYVSGGNGNSRISPAPSPIYVYEYKAGRLSDRPVQEFKHHLAVNQIYWSGLAHHPSKP